MPVLVIDHLKIVNINDEQRSPFPFLPVHQQVFDSLSGRFLVVQPGQGITLRPCL